MLQGLTPSEREQLASSESPRAAFADVQTPQDAMARFKGLDQQTKMQLFATFMRVKDNERGWGLELDDDLPVRLPRVHEPMCFHDLVEAVDMRRRPLVLA
jgi:hypothetical protein